MKVAKLLAVLTAGIAVLAAVALLRPNLCFSGGENYTFYCGTSSADCKVVTAGSFATVEKLCLKNVCGESAEYTTFDLEKFLKSVNGKIVAVEELSDSVNYYCTADLPYSVKIRGKEINLHVCVRADRIKVASPIIFGGY